MDKLMKNKMSIGIALGIVLLCIVIAIIGSMGPKKEPNNTMDENVSQTDEISETETESESEVESETETESETGTESSTETESESETEDEEDEYINFAIADVDSYVNVRTEPNTDCQIVGKMYDGAVAQILETVGEGDDQWFRSTSASPN